jgi:hypothetical protein
MAVASTLKKLSASTGISVRKLRNHIRDPICPLPHYRVGGLILVGEDEFKQWLENFRPKSKNEVRGMVEDIVKKQEGNIPADATSSTRSIPKGWEALPLTNISRNVALEADPPN